MTKREPIEAVAATVLRKYASGYPESWDGEAVRAASLAADLLDELDRLRKENSKLSGWVNEVEQRYAALERRSVTATAYDKQAAELERAKRLLALADEALDGDDTHGRLPTFPVRCDKYEAYIAERDAQARDKETP